MFLFIFTFLIFLFKCFGLLNNNNCILKINSIDEDYLQFQNVSLLTFDSHKKQICDEKGNAEIHLPGWLQIISGNILIKKSLPSFINLNKSLVLALTLEQDSFFVGKICDNGQSQSTFLSDEFCSPFLCNLLPNACKLLELSKIGQLIPISNLFPFNGWLPLEEPLAHPILSGYWNIKAKLLFFDQKIKENNKGKLIAKIENEGWILIKESDNNNNNEWNEEDL